MDRPIRILAAALVAGAVLGRASGGAEVGVVVASVAVCAAAAAAAWWFLTAARVRWTAAAVAVAFASGAFRAAAPPASDLALPGLPVAVVDGIVIAGPDVLRRDPRQRDGAGRRAALHLDLGDAEGRALLDLPPDDRGLPDLLPGDRVRVVGRVRARAPPRNPGESARGNRRPVLEIYAATLERVEGPADHALHAVRRAGERLRAVARDRLRAACGGETPAYGVLLCLLTGDRTALPPSVARAFRDSGTAHLLAVSGLHLVVLVAGAAAVARRLVPPRRARWLGPPAVTALVVAYAAICRFETPVVRSAVFVVVSVCGRTAGRRTSTLDHLALAAAILVAWDPDQVADVGFQLSFAAVAGIALLARPLRSALFPRLALLVRFPDAMPRWRLRLLESFATAVATTLAAQFATAPVVAWSFGSAQPFGLVANLVAVPAFGATLAVAVGLATVGDFVAAVTSPVAETVAAVFVGVADAAASVPLGHFALGRPPPALIAAGVALTAASACVRGPWTRRHLVAPTLAWAAVALGPGLTLPPPRTETVALDVGHGLCVLVRSADGPALLYDCGGRAQGLGDRVVVPALRAMGVRRLAFLFISHEDSDHCSAAVDVLREIDVDVVVVPLGFGASGLAGDVLAACAAAGIPAVRALAGDRFAAAGLRADVLRPRRAAVAGAENADSLVVRVVAGDGALSILLPGDVEDAGTADLAADPACRPCDVVLLPHHGRGDAALHDLLLAAVSAAAAIASESDADAVDVVGARLTGIAGALRVRPGGPLEAWPWPEDD